MGPGRHRRQRRTLLALPIALVAGLLSFVSPCVLPLVPGYLGYVGGTTAGQRTRGRLVLGVALFVPASPWCSSRSFLLAGTVGRFVMRVRDVAAPHRGV